ncbi:MAG: cytochrome c [Gammaproteobacteria bacterium]|nr:cytochrome c [Gammaproteobacteria bacterium]MCF6258785.1 cytochrome c [Gammaproteobacteria bacterium]
MRKNLPVIPMFLSLLLLLAPTGVALAGDPMKGRPLYIDRCSGCHGLSGASHVGHIPNFKLGEGLMKPDQEILAFVKKGKGVMPGFNGILTDTEIRDILAYVRTFF